MRDLMARSPARRDTTWLKPLTLLVMLALAGCSGDGTPSQGGGITEPCSCTLGTKLCADGQIKLCESQSATCSEWGAATSCPSGMCASDSACVGNCQDACAGNATRCFDDGNQEVCRIGPSGCLEWTKQSCGATAYCETGQCVAAIPCDPACPTGYTCNARGVCAGGKSSDLRLDLKTYTVSGSFTLNGATPSVDSSTCSSTNSPSYDKLRLYFRETTKNITYLSYVLCKDSGFPFQVVLPPGTYQVTVNSGYYRSPQNFPQPESGLPVVKDSLVVASNLNGQVFDLKTYTVSGSFTLNGAAPTVDSSTCSSTNSPSYDKLRLYFRETTKNITYLSYVLCKDVGFPFQVVLPPGTYQVTVNSGYYRSPQNFPQPDSGLPVVKDSLVVASDLSGQAFNLKTHTVSGSFTLNGAAPMVDDSTCSSVNSPSYDKLRLYFYETTKNITYLSYVLCKDSGFPFQVVLPPGTYQVSVNSGYYRSPQSFPQPDSGLPVVKDSLVVASDLSGQAFNLKTHTVSGSFTLNGAAPTVDSATCSSVNNPSYDKLRLYFRETTKNITYISYVLCKDSGFPFQVVLPPGTYQVWVNGGYYRSPQSFPQPDSGLPVVKDSLMVASDLNGQLFDLKTYTVSGSFTLNGATPTVDDSTCSSVNSPSYDKLRLYFRETTKNITYLSYVLCKDSGFPFQVVLPPGTYQVWVNSGYYRSPQNFPQPDSGLPVVKDSLVVASNLNGQVFDLKTYTVSGSFTLNGAVPTVDGSTCSSVNSPSYDKLRLYFRETTKSITYLSYVLCKDSGFPFQAILPGGTYEIVVNSGYYRSPQNFPQPDSGLPVLVKRIIIP